MRFFQRLSHVTALLSERSDGPMGSSTNPGENGAFARHRERFLEQYGIRPERLVMAGLVHGTAVRTVFSGSGRVPESDGLISFGPPVGFGVQDCLPLFMAPILPADGLRLAGVAHVGWRGVLNGISAVAAGGFARHGVGVRENLAAAIGPGIRECCFTVHDDVAARFRDAGYGAFVRPADADANGPRFAVDLLGILCQQLEELGIPRGNIEVEGALCTVCARTDAGEPRFASWRRDRIPAANMLAVIRVGGREYESYHL